MTSKAARFITQLMAEIAERDARIAELEAQKNRLIGGNADLSSRVRELEHKMDYYNAQPSACVIGGTGISSSMRGALAEAGKQPSAGVVLPDRAKENEGNSYSIMQAMAYNQALDEVARLNPCRAQAVPSWADAVEACAKLCEERAAYYESGDDDAPGSRRGSACRHCADVIRYNLTDPPTKKESGDEQI